MTKLDLKPGMLLFWESQDKSKKAIGILVKQDAEYWDVVWFDRWEVEPVDEAMVLVWATQGQSMLEKTLAGKPYRSITFKRSSL